MTKNTYIIAGIVVAIVIFTGFYLQTRPQEVTITQEEANQVSVSADENAPFGLSVPLFPQSDSGQAGGVDLVDVGENIEVTIYLENVPVGVSQPAHLHLGSCDALGKIVFPLNPIVDGSSQTTLDVSGEEFQSQLPLAVNVHKSEEELSVNIVCGFVSEE